MSTIGTPFDRLAEGHCDRYRSFQFRSLTQRQIDLLHDASLEIMERTGMCFYDQNALDLFKRAGARIMDDNRVHIPAHLVERALQSAPKTIPIYDRHGNRAMILGGPRCYYGPGSDCASIYDLQTGQHRLAVLDDVVDGVRLTDALPNMDYVMSMFLPSDVPQARYERHQMAIMLNESTKPILFVGIEAQSTVDALEMASIVAGSEADLAARPFVVNYVNVVSPLKHNEESVQRLLYAAERNIPTIYIPGATIGTSAPTTTAGAMALKNAGQLGDIVLSQLAREGSPLITGAPGGGSMDMRTMLSLYTAPEGGPYGWDMARHYGLPTFTIACTDSKIFDAQAAAETALTLFEKTLNGANIIHDCGYLDCAMTMCLELEVFSDEVIEWIKRYFQPLEINEETLALDLIHEVGPDGHYLDSDHTLRHFKEAWTPSLLDRHNFESWSAQGGTTLQQRANEKARELIASHRAEPLAGPVIRQLEKIVARS